MAFICYEMMKTAILPKKDQKIWLDGVYEMNEIEQLNWKILSVECQLIESKFLLRYCF